MKMKIVGKRMFSAPNILVFAVSNIPISILIVAAARHRVSPLQITEGRHFRVSFFVFKKLCNAVYGAVVKKKVVPPKSSTFFSQKKMLGIHSWKPPNFFWSKAQDFTTDSRHNQIQETQVEIRPSPVTQRSCLGQSLVELGKEWDAWGWLGWLGWLGYHLIPAGRTWDAWDGDDMWLKQCHLYHDWKWLGYRLYQLLL